VKPIRFAVVGCGTAARQIHLPALREAGADVTVFASRTRASAESLCDAWAAGTVVDHWEDAVGRDDVDAVLVATPNANHCEVAVAAAAAGKHVLVDKPLACNTLDADVMIAAAAQHDVLIVPFQNSRFAAPFVAAQQHVAAGRIGEVTGFRAAYGHGGPQQWAAHADWFFDSARAGGGCLMDLGVHIIDVVRAVTGDEIASVSALCNGRRGDVETDAQLLARLDGGAIGTIEASWSSSSGPDHQLTVIGTDASLHLDSRTPLTLLAPDGARERIELPESTSSPLAELLAAIAGQRAPSVTAADGRAAVAVVEAAYHSAAHDSVQTEVD
jgi:predicted dehydrogenase